MRFHNSYLIMPQYYINKRIELAEFASYWFVYWEIKCVALNSMESEIKSKLYSTFDQTDAYIFFAFEILGC